MDSQGNYKDGADLFGPKMQQLRLQLLQQHQDYHKLREDPVEQVVHPPPPPHKVEASMAKKGMSLAVWFCFNSLTLILNKYVASHPAPLCILNQERRYLFSVVDFHYPLSLTAVHMITCFILSFLIIRVFKWVPFQPTSRNDILTKILPLSIVFCANIVFGNFSIRWIPISFMQTVKVCVWCVLVRSHLTNHSCHFLITIACPFTSLSPSSHVSHSPHYSYSLHSVHSSLPYTP